MDELKLLIEMVANLPSMALWVLVGFWAYKVIVIGSIYGVIRFVVEKFHSWAVAKKSEKPREVECKEIRPMLDGMCIKAETDFLIAQLHRIRGKGLTIKSDYIHRQSIDWLREAIDEKIEKDQSVTRRAA